MPLLTSREIDTLSTRTKQNETDGATISDECVLTCVFCCYASTLVAACVQAWRRLNKKIKVEEVTRRR